MPREDALSLAIALFHEPGLRHGWRREPLPPGIGPLLALAGGDPRRLDPAAASLGVSPEELLQAVRFYVQEILLFDGADDRRLLGLAHGDGAEALRSHYRSLQSWLHPDRGGGDRAETIHAARINAAWSRLRAAPAVAAALPSRGNAIESRDAPLTAPTPRVRRWMRVDGDAAQRPKHWLLAVPLAIALGGGWLWLASHPPTAPRDAWPVGEEAGTADASIAATGPTEADARPVAIPAQPAPFPHTAPGTDAAQASVVSALRPSVPAIATRARPAPPLSAPAAMAGPTQVASTTASDAGNASTAREGRVQPPAKPAAQSTRPATATVAAIPATRPPSLEAAPSPRSGSEPHDLDPVPVPTTATLPAPAIAATSAPPAPPATAEPEPLGRSLAAQRRGDALLAYLTHPRQAMPPPIWSSGHALDDATAIRADLAEGGRHRPLVLHDQARWQIEPGQAHLRVPVQPADRSGTRLLHAGLRWENDAWWVESIALEDAR